MNNYYNELAELIYDESGIHPYERVYFKNHYLTVEDYVIYISFTDTIKNIYSLLNSLSTEGAIFDFIESAIIRSIQETLLENHSFANFFRHRIKNSAMSGEESSFS